MASIMNLEFGAAILRQDKGYKLPSEWGCDTGFALCFFASLAVFWIARGFCHSVPNYVHNLTNYIGSTSAHCDDPKVNSMKVKAKRKNHYPG